MNLKELARNYFKRHDAAIAAGLEWELSKKYNKGAEVQETALQKFIKAHGARARAFKELKSHVTR